MQQSDYRKTSQDFQSRKLGSCKISESKSKSKSKSKVKVKVKLFFFNMNVVLLNLNKGMFLQ